MSGEEIKLSGGAEMLLEPRTMRLEARPTTISLSTNRIVVELLRKGREGMGNLV